MIDPRSILTYGACAGLAMAIAWGGVERARGASARQALADYRVAAQQQAETQREANRGRAAEVEERIVTQTVYRDRYITTTVKEIERVTEPLASCPVPIDAVRLLNDAGRCAREDRPATCGVDDAVPGAR